MNKGIYTTSYMITMGLAFIYLVTEPDIRRCYSRPSFIVEFDGESASVIDESSYFQSHDSFEGFEGVFVSASPQVSRGPMDNRFTFYYRIEFMSDRSRVLISDCGEHSERQLDLAFEAVLAFIKDDPSYAYLRPGEPARIEIDPYALASCTGGLIGVAVVPGLVSWFLCCAARLRQESSYAYRQAHNMCVGCGYSTLGLDTGVCPECGQQHRSAFADVV